ncbi:MAG: homoserine dehydrogenase [Anaerolineae bacterium SM23_ 63]|nr:MAG: homoserine dehydrogenase [Anaerolineae bacterium SM23_ 63]
MKKMKIALLGFGNVGRALAQLLIAKREVLREQYQIEWSIVGIATRRHGSVLKPSGIDLEAALSLATADKEISTLAPNNSDIDGVTFVRMSGADVLFENTPVNYQTGQPAIDHITTALELGMHAITANKGPVVHAFDRLAELAQAKGARFLYESTVMDGAPIFSLWQEVLPVAKLHSFRGVLNSTTNLILTLMETEKSFDEALAHTQAIGIAETDPSGDIMGWDSAVKVAALVTVLMGIPLPPDIIKREGIEHISLEDVIKAREEGRRWKLICQAWRDGKGVKASVGPEQIDPNDSLYNVMGTSSAVTFVSDVLGDLTITETNPGPHTTAYGLLADFIRAVR